MGGRQTKLPDGARRVRAVNEIITRLCDLLIAAPLSKTALHRTPPNADIDVSGVSWSASPSDFWWHVVRRAHTARTIESLFEAADHVFGENSEWADAKQSYRTARDG